MTSARAAHLAWARPRWRSCGVKVADARVVVLVVVPGEEVAAVSASVFLGAKACRKVWTVFQSLELRFRERVIVGDMGPRVALGDAEVGQ